MSSNQIRISPARGHLRALEKDEKILQENDERWVLFPIEFPSLWEFYKKIETSFWTPEDYPWKDEAQLIRAGGLSDSTKAVLKTFALHFNLVYGVPASTAGLKDGINGFLFPDILDLSCEFVEAIQTPEGRAYLGFQAMYENFHREVFTRQLKSLGEEPDNYRAEYVEEQSRPSLVAKQRWLAYHMEGFHQEEKIKKLAGDVPDFVHTIVHGSDDPAPMAEVLVTLTIMKTIFTSGLVLVHELIENAPLSAIRRSSEKVWTDCILHGDFSAHLYSSLDGKIDSDVVRSMLCQAIELEYEYLLDVTGGSLNVEQTCRFLQDMGLRTLAMLGFSDDEQFLLPNLPTKDKGNVGGKMEITIPPLFQIVHKGPIRIVPAEKRSTAEQQLSSNATTTLPVFQTDEDF